MRTIIAGNWKMHKDRTDAEALVQELVRGLNGTSFDVEVVIAPPFPYLQHAVDLTQGSRIEVAAQNCHFEPHGAYTGEVSVPMLKSIGIGHVIVGHSERREYFDESDTDVGLKVSAASAGGLAPILCCGEQLEHRDGGSHFEVVREQLMVALSTQVPEVFETLTVAYEPVWAIGTGRTATAVQAQEMHAFIRQELRGLCGIVAEGIPILYGGSCKPENAAELFAGEDVNGGLIGGASLLATSFLDLVRIAHTTKSA